MTKKPLEMITFIELAGIGVSNFDGIQLKINQKTANSPTC